MEVLPEKFDLSLLKEIANNNDNQNFKRLCLEYLPLKFSRRHGDPKPTVEQIFLSTLAQRTVPKYWTMKEIGVIFFQNWEALAHALP